MRELRNYGLYEAESS